MPTIQIAIDASAARRGASTYVAATKRMQGASRQIDKGVRGLDTSMSRLGKTSSGLRTTLGALFGGLSGVLILRQATKAIADFGETLATVKGVANATSEEFKQLSETAKLLGATTRFTASEAGEGMLFLARAGFTVVETLEAVNATLTLASAGQLELGEAADFASNILQQFNLSAEQTVRVADTLVTVSNSANTNVRQLAEALKFAGPIAGALGQSMETTAAAIGVLGDAGIQGTMAGTNMRQAFLKLLQPTKEGATAIKGMGLTLEEVNPVMNDFVDILQKLSDANLSAADAVSIFQTRNAAAALLLTRNVDKVRELTKAAQENMGASQRLSDIIEDTLAGSFRALRSSVEAVFIAFGDSGLNGVLRTTTDFLTDVFRTIAGVNAELRFSQRSIDLAVSGFRAMVAALAALVAIKIVVFLGGMAAALISATAAMLGFNVAIATNPLVFLPATIIAAVAALVFFKDELITIKGQTASVMDFMVESWNELARVIAFTTTAMGAGFDIMFENANTALDLIIGAITVAETRIKNLTGEFSIAGAAVGLAIPPGIARPEEELFGPPAPTRTPRLQRIANEAAERKRLRDKQFSDDLAQVAEAGKLRATIDAEQLRIRQELHALELEALMEGRSRELAREIDMITKATKDANKELSKMKQIADGIGTAFADAFTEAIIGARSLQEAVQQLGQEIARLVVRQTIAEPISEAISLGVESALKGVTGIFAPQASLVAATTATTSGGEFELANDFFNRIASPFQTGGIVTSKQIGLLGEAGPEAVIPLKRGASGKLGIEGGRNLSIVFNVTTPNVESFRRSQSQITRELVRIANGIT